MLDDRTQTVTAFHESAEWTGVRTTEREQWLALRRTLLTASDFAAVLDRDPHKDALSVYYDKIAETPSEKLTIEDGRFWGLALEQTVLQTTANYYGWDYRPGGYLLRSRRHPLIGVTLDGEIDRHDGRGWIPNECKNTEIEKHWDPEKQNCPLHVMIQVQAQLLVTGAELAVCFALLSRWRPALIVIEANPGFQEVLIDGAEEFMARVRERRPPDATSKSGEVLKRMFPHEDGTMITLPPEAVEWTRELFEIREEIKRLKAREEELENLIRQRIGSSTFGLLPEPVNGKKAWRWHTTERAAHQVSASSSRTLLLLNEPTLPKQKKPGNAPMVTQTVVANDVALATSDLIRMPSAKRRR